MLPLKLLYLAFVILSFVMGLLKIHELGHLGVGSSPVGWSSKLRVSACLAAVTVNVFCS